MTYREELELEEKKAGAQLWDALDANSPTREQLRARMNLAMHYFATAQSLYLHLQDEER